MQPSRDVRLWLYFWVIVCLCARARTSVAADVTSSDMSTDTTLESASTDDPYGSQSNEHCWGETCCGNSNTDTDTTLDSKNYMGDDPSERSQEADPSDGATTAKNDDPRTSPLPGGGNNNTDIPWLTFFCVFSSICCLLLSLQ